MICNIEAVAFDIDGTLYPSWKLFIRMPFYMLRNFRFYLHFNKIRNTLHSTAPLPDLYEYQARLYAESAHVDVAEARRKIQDVSYDGLKKKFRKIKPYDHAYEFMKKCKDAGLKVGILSDFPPSQKDDIWGMKELCDVCIGSEEAGCLKPCIYPFGILAQKLGVDPSKILYVGNSHRYDVIGAKNAGMRSAYILTGLKKIFNRKDPDADISFRNYRELERIVFQK